MLEFLTAPKPIRSVLIANRGEIACRIIRTCRTLGLRAIAVYSDADADALHVRMADMARCIGPDASAQSYLNIPAVIAAAQACGADAVHPGYGFLSENADFVRACGAAGLIFIGPSPEAVARMGSKIEARQLAEAAGVPVVPGFEGTDATEDDLHAAADRIGYPIMVKANSGGGGRGMRRVASPDALDAALGSARQEAGAAFGDDTVFLEKLIESPRHLEVQVFGDGQGDALHFHERDCSVQRNHQKLIEEAPAPNLADDVRQSLFDSALKLTREMRYAGAGTVEFIMEADGTTPYFLEMNTRLQVEHPVTEEVCGVDLVAFQLRQAAGLPLALSQDQVRVSGHAIEVRLNAERPEADFLPATGTFLHVAAPEGLRFETGVEAGSTVTTHYDSMLAKLIAHGPDRDSARCRLIEGLDRLSMVGVAVNQAFLADCLRADAFAVGRATTDFLQDTFPDGWHPDPAALLRLRGAAALHMIRQDGGDPVRRGDGFRVTGLRRAAVATLQASDAYGVSELVLRIGAESTVESGGIRVTLDGSSPRLWRDGPAWYVAGKGLTLEFTLGNAAEAALGGAGAGASEGAVVAPLTGLISKVHVRAGDHVAHGEALIEMEAMKLVHTLKAPFEGVVATVSCAERETVQAKAVLIEIEEEA